MSTMQARETDDLLIAVGEYMDAVKDIFVSRPDGKPYAERNVIYDSGALRAFDRVAEATVVLEKAMLARRHLRSRAMSEPMTLEQVRNWHRMRAKTYVAAHCHSAEAELHQRMADAIDAAIAERDEWKSMVADWRTKAATLEAQRNDALVRINDAPVGQSLGMVVYYDDGQEHAAALLEGKRVRLVVEDET